MRTPAILACALLLNACASSHVARIEIPDCLNSAVSEYQTYAVHKAFAVGKTLDGCKCASVCTCYGYGFGYSTEAEAIERALAECRSRFPAEAPQEDLCALYTSQ